MAAWTNDTGNYWPGFVLEREPIQSRLPKNHLQLMGPPKLLLPIHTTNQQECMHGAVNVLIHDTDACY